MDISDFTATDLQDDLIGPIIFKEYRQQVTKRMEVVGDQNITAGYISSLFQNFESHLRTAVDLVEDDIKLALEEYSSSFITYELQPGFYTFKDLSEALFNILQPDYPGPSNVVVIEFDDITMKTKMVVRSGILAIRFHEKSFVVLFSLLLQVGIINTITNTLVKKL